MNRQSNRNNWLERVKANSWESEILLVGFVLIILIQLINFSPQLQYKMLTYNSITNLYGIINVLIIPFLLNTLYLSNLVLIVNLSIYLVIRGLWIGTIGLSSVFPKGININFLKFSNNYKIDVYNKDLDQYSKIVDKVCSSIFSISFLIIFLLVSLSLFIIEIVFSLLILGEFTEYLSLTNPETFSSYIPIVIKNVLSIAMLISFLIFVLSGFIYIIDILLLYPLKSLNNKYFIIIYRFFERIYRFLFITFVYETLLLTVISNIKKRTIYAFVLVGIITGYFISSWSFINISVYESNVSEIESKGFNKYENLLEKYQLLNGKENLELLPMIQSDIVSENYLKLFIPYMPQVNSFLNDCMFKNNENKTMLNCIDDLYAIYIDDELIDSLAFHFYTHPINNQKGFISIIGIENLTIGNHLLLIKSESYNTKYESKGIINIGIGDSRNRIEESIPFYKVEND
jgi:hypothetical protein